MFISVIVPVYNVEKYLDKCLASLLDQHYPDMEIIVVDDIFGSAGRSMPVGSRRPKAAK